jgi:hypothetical protein
MSKSGSNRLADRYEWREVWAEDCSHGRNLNNLFLGHGFHMLGPGASQKVHNAISHEDRSKIKMTICGGLTTITVRLETITESGAIFIRDTIPQVRYLVRKYNVAKDEDNENGKFFFSSRLADVALRLGPYMSISSRKDICTRTNKVHKGRQIK